MPLAVQRSFDDLGTPLSQVTFVVLDVETTGGSPAIGLPDRGGRRPVPGRRAAGHLPDVRPTRRAHPALHHRPHRHQRRHGGRRPPVGEMLPSFLEFLGGGVVVGHNVRFDLSFLNHALESTGRDRLANATVDTLALARRLVRDMVPDCKLGTLADSLRLPHQPSHRALTDVLATGDLLHALLERAGTFGIVGLEELLDLPRLVGHPQAAKLRLTTRLPHRPGVYWFSDAAGDVLYVGRPPTSTAGSAPTSRATPAPRSGACSARWTPCTTGSARAAVRRGARGTPHPGVVAAVQPPGEGAPTRPRDAARDAAPLVPTPDTAMAGPPRRTRGPPAPVDGAGDADGPPRTSAATRRHCSRPSPNGWSPWPRPSATRTAAAGPRRSREVAAPARPAPAGGVAAARRTRRPPDRRRGRRWNWTAACWSDGGDTCSGRRADPGDRGVPSDGGHDNERVIVAQLAPGATPDRVRVLETSDGNGLALPADRIPTLAELCAAVAGERARLRSPTAAGAGRPPDAGTGCGGQADCSAAASSVVTRMKSSRTAAARPAVDELGGQRHTGRQVGRRPITTSEAAAFNSGDVPVGRVVTGHHPADGRGVDRGVAPPEVVERGPGEAEVGRVDPVDLHRHVAVVGGVRPSSGTVRMSSWTVDGPVVDSSSRPSSPWTTMARRRPVGGQDTEHLVGHGRVADPHHLELARAGLARGPRKLNTVGIPRSLRTGPANRMAGWKRGAKQNPIPTSSMHRATPAGPRSATTPSASSTSAAPTAEDEARPPCLHTLAPGGGDHQRGDGRHVDGPQPVASGPAGVDHVGARRQRQRHGVGDHGADEAGHLRDGLALGPQRDGQRGDLGRGGLARRGPGRGPSRPRRP